MQVSCRATAPPGTCLARHSASIETPIQITFHGLEPSEAVEAQIRTRALELERFASQVTYCHVTMERTSNRHHKGNLYAVCIDARVPNAELVASRKKHLDHAHED